MLRKKMNLLAAPFGAVAILALSATQAAAHAELVGAEPAADVTVSAPEQIVLHFSEAVEARVSSLSVADADGQSISISPAAAPDEKSLAATPDAPFAPGPYTVSWTAVGGDGHPARGTLSFTVE
jgi:methionine-rich copper-binding protein CopC